MQSDEAKKKAGKKTVHWHGCIRCRVAAYQDNCTTPGVDDVCVTCRGGRGFQILIDGRKPRDCCRQLARLATKDEKKTYSLAGSCLWFICRACARTQPFDPKEKT